MKMIGGPDLACGSPVDTPCFILYLGSLGDQLRGIELGHHALEHLVDDGRKHTLVIVFPQLLVHDWQAGGTGPRKHTKTYVHHLKICDGQSHMSSEGAGHKQYSLNVLVIDEGNGERQGMLP